MSNMVEIGPVVFKKIFKVRQYIFAISLLSPLGKERGPAFEETLITITLECFVPSLVEIGLEVLKKNIFKVRQYISVFFIISTWKRAWPFI